MKKLLIIAPVTDPPHFVLPYAACKLKEIARLLTLSPFYKDVLLLYGKEATASNCVSAIKTFDPDWIWGLGHGLEDKFTVENYEVLWTTERGLELVTGRGVCLLSCKTGARLGKKMIEAGASFFVGYHEEFWLIIDKYKPCEVRAVVSPLICDLEAQLSLATGFDQEKAYINAVTEVHKEINYWQNFWEEEAVSKETAQLIITTLIHNLNCMVYYPKPPVLAPYTAPTGAATLFSSLIGVIGAVALAERAML